MVVYVVLEHANAIGDEWAWEKDEVLGVYEYRQRAIRVIEELLTQAHSLEEPVVWHGDHTASYMTRGGESERNFYIEEHEVERDQS